ncbi:MAG: 3TM-type holin [Bacillota bacterium]|nr:3TM-type holin [Bacillota bacterium]
MDFFTTLPVIGKIIEKGLDVVDQFVEDKDQANKIKAAITEKINEQDHKKVIEEIRASAEIIKTEATGSWLQKNWRPMLMLTIIAIIFNNYVLFPYLSMFTSKAVILELPGGLWALLNVGVGGYVAGRSAEKIFSLRKGR